MQPVVGAKQYAMREKFPKNSFHKFLIADVFPSRLSDDDAMLVFALLHTHIINVVDAVVPDAPSVRSFAAITQRHAGECLGYLWRDTDDERRHYTHWYWLWNTDWSYNRVDELDGADLDRFNELNLTIAAHPAVESVEPEDD